LFWPSALGAPSKFKKNSAICIHSKKISQINDFIELIFVSEGKNCESVQALDLKEIVQIPERKCLRTFRFLGAKPLASLCSKRLHSIL
jgi:hypothetical protein